MREHSEYCAKKEQSNKLGRIAFVKVFWRHLFFTQHFYEMVGVPAYILDSLPPVHQPHF